MKRMSKRERISAVLENQPVDRVPVSFWRHFYEHEDTPQGLANAMLSFQDNYDWDFMKVNPRASYHHEDWGACYRFFKDGFTKPERLSFPLSGISDLERIKPLEPLKTVSLREHLDALHYISKGINRDVPFIMTIFTPLSILADMAESLDRFREFMLEDPALVKNALEAVTLTFEKFTLECLNAGISGIYFATTYWGNYDRLNDGMFDEFSRPYDMRILSLVKECPLNILHVCKGNNMLLKLSDYPVNLFSWDATDSSNVNLWEGRKILKKAVIGGIDHRGILPSSSRADCIRQADVTLEKMGIQGWMLGGGCTFSPAVPSENLKALREWAEKIPLYR